MEIRTCWIKYKDCELYFECTSIKDDLIKYKCLCFNKNYDENFKKRFAYTYKFSNHYIIKFILFLQKGVYPYEYNDDWKKFNEMSLPDYIYSQLNVEDITDSL